MTEETVKSLPGEAENPAEADIEARLNELNRRETRLLALETLQEKGLSRELGDLLDYSSRESCQASIERLEKALAKEVARQIEKRLGGERTRLPGQGAALDEDQLSDSEYYALKLGKRARRA